MSPVTSGCLLLLIALAPIKQATIVYPRMLESRSEDGLKLLKINDKITLKLSKSSVLPEDFLVYSTKDDVPIVYHMRGDEVENSIYEDAEQMATVDLSHDDGITVKGVLSSNLRIRPLEGMERSVTGETPHELYEVEQPDDMESRHGDYATPPANETVPVVESRQMSGTTGPVLRATIYPEIHVVVDYFISQALGFAEKAIAKYVAVMIGSANLRYRSISQPQVRLRLVGVSVTKKKDEEPYMVHISGYETTRNILFGETIEKFKEHVKLQTYFSGSDIIFLLTGLNMSEWRNGVLEHWTGGFAYIAGACTKWKVGMSEERVKSFYGVFVFAHEIAHSLGCNHDGEPANSWPTGHIGSEDCPWDDGYMMSYKFVEPNMYRFSSCCQREIRNLHSRPEYRCLIQKNSGKVGITTSKLPGDISDLQTYCEKVYYDHKYVKADLSYDLSKCIVRCFISQNGDNMLIAAVDGVDCGNGKVCILGNCTSKADLGKTP